MFFNLVTTLFTLKSFFYCFLNIKNDRALFIILNVLFLKIFLLIFIKKKFLSSNLIFLINVVIIIFILFLLINIIISFFFIDIFMIIIIEFFVKYDIYNNLNFSLIISIVFFI